MQGGSESNLAVTMAEMSRDLLAQDTVQRTLDRIVEHAIDLVDGCEHAGILLLQKGKVETLAVSDDLVRRSDRIQAELREGPCFDAAANSEQVYRIADLNDNQQRWPRYGPRARDLGIGSMMGFLLYTDADEFGALDLYSSRPGAFTERAELTGWLVASHAAVAMSSARLGAQLHSSITTRQVIGEALGIVMERYKVGEDQAFEVLKTGSQHRNVKLREIAEQITRTGEVPGER
ncbi:GAF and ANTAR domain-containing protein [Saccharopolyspora sp. NPDC002578]